MDYIENQTRRNNILIDGIKDECTEESTGAYKGLYNYQRDVIWLNEFITK